MKVLLLVFEMSSCLRLSDTIRVICKNMFSILYEFTDRKGCQFILNRDDAKICKQKI